jgi:hypothetical protein
MTIRIGIARMFNVERHCALKRISTSRDHCRLGRMDPYPSSNVTFWVLSRPVILCGGCAPRRSPSRENFHIATLYDGGGKRIYNQVVDSRNGKQRRAR